MTRQLPPPTIPGQHQPVHGSGSARRAGGLARRIAALLFCGCVLPAVAADASTVYRWVDDTGTVHYSEVVPERYRDTARPLQPPAPPTAEQQRQAQQRLQQQKAKAAAVDTGGEPTAAPVPPAASRPVGKRPSQLPDEQTDCDTWQRLYDESEACFGPYRTVGGGVKAEAFAVCNVVHEPPVERCRRYIR
ncbi:DUF4124 domain-containing protein [Rubrivivax gelatinosus]|uniref:DUF4124 domain-containing protein n=1 Tax=Rubrivivax gelatinosus TaxID=28068 RepID=A0ABS1DU66_RUBGE|nr:DUF4124 domain-containing protein [Rubrivivax gelatinosus]MBK1713263.1 hypothetical protein [Rubrivivax gelatinosus]